MGKAVFIQCGSHGPGGLRRVAQPGRQCFQSSAKIQVCRDGASASCAMLSVCAAWSYDNCSAESSIICSERPLLLTLVQPALTCWLQVVNQPAASQIDKRHTMCGQESPTEQKPCMRPLLHSCEACLQWPAGGSQGSAGGAGLPVDTNAAPAGAAPGAPEAGHCGARHRVPLPRRLSAEHAG